MNDKSSVTDADRKKAKKALTRARVQLVVSQPFFGCLSLLMEPVEVLNKAMVNTMAVDGKHLFYHPPFVNTLSEVELVGVCAHETLHCAFKHMTRRGHRDPRKWNIAADFVINADLIAAGFTLPGKPIGLNSPPGVKGYLFDPSLKGLSTEAVYERLPDPPTITIMISGSGNGDKGQQSAAQPHDDGGCGGVIDAAGSGDSAGQDKVDRDWDTNVRMAVAVAKGQNAGTVPEYLRRLVEDLDKPVVNWRDETRQFIDGAMSVDYSWQRPNRRFVGSGLHLPGFIPDTLHKIIFLGDVSGSISHEVMKAYLSEVSGALDDHVADELVVAYFDTEIKKVDEYVPGDVIKADVPGGGGTDFRPAFQYAIDMHPDASCIICLTDMCPNSWDLPATDTPVLWAAWGTEEFISQVKGQVPYGKIILVDHL